MKKLITIIAVFFLFISCRKEIIEVSSDDEGHWFGDVAPTVHSILNIDSQSHLYYHGFNHRRETAFEFGGTAKLKNNTIYVGIRPRFNIISPPTKISSSPFPNNPNLHWTMKLRVPEGYDITFYRE